MTITGTQKQYIVAGVIALGAIVLFYHFAKTPSKPTQKQPAQPAPLSASNYPPPGIAQYPSGNFSPVPISIQDAPLVFNYNYPSTRTPDLGDGGAGNGCGCCKDENKPLSPQIFVRSAANMKSVASKFAIRQQRA
jgi:hypothetical protein